MRDRQAFLFPLDEPSGNALPGEAPGKRSPQPPTVLKTPSRPPAPVQPDTPLARLDHLRQLVRRMETGGRSAEAPEPVVFSAGGAVLDALLPHGGLRAGTLVEWVCDARQCGGMLLAMIAAAEVLAHPLRLLARW
jgi:hypothetical protein